MSGPTWEGMEALADASDARADGLSAQLATATSDLSTVTSQRDAAARERDLAMTEQQRLLGVNQTLTGQVTSLQAALATATADDASDDQKIAALTGQVSNLTATVATLNQQAAAYQTERASLLARIADLEGQVPQAKMKLGNGWGVSELQYLADRDARGFRMFMNYRPLEPRWGDVDQIPAGDSIWLQSKATTKAAFAATIDSIPMDRAADVVLYPWNEAAAKLTLAEFRTYMGWCRELIDASGKPIRLGQQQSDWILFPAANVDEDAWFTGHEDIIGWSGFANAKVENGVTVPALQATQLMDLVDAYSDRHGIPYAFPVWGMPLIVGTDWAASKPIRLAWMKATYARMVASRCESAGLYNGLWNAANGQDLDYRLDSDTTHLLPWWNSIKGAHV